MAVTVDHLSGGRLEMGLGAGGDVPVDAMLGLPNDPIPTRIDALSEACRLMKLLWVEPTATFDGRHYRLEEAFANPKPVQRPHPPLWMGSSGERRGLRVVAEHADVWIPATMPGEDPAELRRLSGVLDQHCAEICREPSTIRRAAQVRLPADADEAMRTVEAHLDAGFDDVILMLFDGGAQGLAAAETAVDLLPRLRELG
jgi:alkanesulfonate monooxygenase SsuD/methylene tetrahydromethanopterin reductase-like flavin-dependent oxidoreductase (luciferase family)